MFREVVNDVGQLVNGVWRIRHNSSSFSEVFSTTSSQHPVDISKFNRDTILAVANAWKSYPTI